MAEALARGFVDKGCLRASEITATDPSASRRDVFSGMGATAVTSSSEVPRRRPQPCCWGSQRRARAQLPAVPPQVAKRSDIVFVAVKPPYVTSVLREVKQHLTDKHCIVSIAAGVTLANLKARLPCCPARPRLPAAAADRAPAPRRQPAARSG